MDAGLLPLAFGLGLIGSLTPCALGINALFLGYVKGKERAVRLLQGAVFALVRAAFLMLLGLLFAFIGQQIVSFELVYQKFIAILLILLGALFIASRYRAVPLPNLSFVGKLGQGRSSAVALGALFGLDIPACTSPLVLALLGQTALVGDLALGALSLLIFGLGMSFPLLLVAYFEGANRLMVRLSGHFNTGFSWGAGLLLFVLGLAQLSPRVMAVVGSLVTWVASPFVGGLI